MRLWILGFLAFWPSVVALAQPQPQLASQAIILIGDGGAEQVINLRDQIHALTTQGIPATVIFLGDNIYPKGMPDKLSPDRPEAERRLMEQLDLAAGAERIYVVPGNHDWKNGHHDGLRYLKNQQAFIDSLHKSNVYFLPRDGCPGPEEIKLADDVLLVVLNTQWFLHPWDKPEGDQSPCDSKSAADVTIHLDDMLNRNQGKRIIVAGHHPVYTYGPHGGVFTWKDHLFPLTAAQKNLYVPLPIVGSLVPLYRSVFGHVQDAAHPVNKALRHGLEDVLSAYPGTIYVSGHEHALQYTASDSVYYVVSGAASKSSAVRQKGKARFVSPDQGIAQLLLMKDGTINIEYYTLKGKVFETVVPKVKAYAPEKFVTSSADTLWVGSRASFQYDANNFRRRLLGANYRAEWALRLQLEAFDIGREHGGLSILSKGGGAETMALRLADHQGRQFTLRTVEKFPERALPVSFRKTFVQAVKQDQVSAEHPYAALVIPRLASAAGIYHTNPKVVYAPNDQRWGVYRKDFAGQPMMFEERPDGSGKGMDFFGNPTKMISTHRMLEHMADDNDIKIDQPWVLRSRLFDMWIGDWDRHDDQWRWGEYGTKKEKVYRPIPRDRDQAFFLNEGFLPAKLRKRHNFPQLEGFGDHVRWVPGLMKVGRHFDRSFLNQLNREDFRRVALDLSQHLTDASIDSALRAWPKDVFALHGQEIARRLKSRRSNLVADAQIYYAFLAREVDVVGSNQSEWFDATWLPGGNLSVKMYNINKQGHKGRLLFDREFVAHETRELRLYGLGGKDIFHFAGVSGRQKVRIVGGEGKDSLMNESSGRRRVWVYDQPAGIQLAGRRVFNRTSDDPHVNDYDRKDFEYNRFAPKHTVSYNIDDGIFLGPGFSTIAHGFRKKPYSSHHMLQASVAVRTLSFTVKYEGRFPQWIGKWDLEIDADVRSPNFVNNFFGWGNESVYDQNINQQPNIDVPNAIDYYRLRFRDFRGEARLRRRLGQWAYVKAGPIFHRGEVVKPSGDRFINVYDATLPESILAIPRTFLGVGYVVGIDRRDNITYTTRGLMLKYTSRWMNGLDAPNYTSHNASLTIYQSFRLPAKVTYVFNAGGGFNTGTYQLFQAQALDGKTDVRGFRKTRFYGDSKAYFNNEMRVRLGNLRTFLFPASFGVHAFYDVGRVWYKDANGVDPSAPTGTSDVWHHGYGGGIWLIPYEMTTIVSEVGHSAEGTLFYLRLGFNF